MLIDRTLNQNRVQHAKGTNVSNKKQHYPFQDHQDQREQQQLGQWLSLAQSVGSAQKNTDVKGKDKAIVTGITRAYAEETADYLAVGNIDVSNTWQKRNEVNDKTSRVSYSLIHRYITCEIVNGVAGYIYRITEVTQFP